MIGLYPTGNAFQESCTFFIVKNDMVYNGATPFIPPRLQRNVIERDHETQPYALFSDNAKTFTNGKITYWLEIQGCKN